MGARTRGFANNVLTSGKLDATDGLTGNLASTNFANATVTNIEELPPAVGSAISSVAGNPAAPVAEGKIWYNTSTDSFNVAATTTATSSSAPLGTARYNAGAGGTTSAAWIAGGYPLTANTEEYNGSGWSVGGSLNTSRGGLIGTGLQTAGLAMGGGPGAAPYTSAVVEEYDGSTWTTVTSMSVERLYAGASGTQTAGAVFSGNTTPNATVRTSTTEEYDGSSWTSGGTVNDVQGHLGGCGTQTASLKAGGDTPGGSSNTSEEYNGTSWSVGNTLNTARRADGLSGLQTNAVLMGGYAPGASTGYTNIEEYDGTSFSNSSASLAAVTYYNTTAGNTSGNSALSAGGKVSGSTSGTTEEYNVSLNVITAGAWASGANYPVTIQDAAGAGPVTANATWGGYDGPAYTAATNEYNGSAWTSSGNMNTARSIYHTGIGSQTAALGASGYVPGGGPTGSTNTESYDGSTWTNVNSLSTSRYNASATGIQTSAILTGGNTPSETDATEEWDGTSWTAGGSTPVVSAGKSMSGQSNTDAILIGANNPPASTYITLSYNGTSWSDTGHNLLDRKDTVAGGSQQGTTSAAIIAGGFDSTPAIVSTSFQYDGSSWVTGPSISTARRGGAASGTYQSALAIGGEQPAQSNATEEWTGETSALNVESLTTS